MGRLALAAVIVAIGYGAGQAQPCTDITGKICSLSNFEPNPGAAGTDAASSPRCDNPDLATPSQKAEIQEAFKRAPPHVKKDLCDITNVFVLPTKINFAWGRWEDPRFHTPAGKTQIAISSDQFGKTFSAIQDQRIGDLVNPHLFKHGESVVPPPRDPNPIQPKTLGLLYIIAHELGHIKWHREPSSGTPVVCPDDPNFYSWRGITNAQGRRWTGFGDENAADIHLDPVLKPSAVTNAADLEKIYHDGGFPTGLGAASPEEDFVESYAVQTIDQACKRAGAECTFNIMIGSAPDTFQINSNRRNSHLVSKFSLCG